MNRDHGGLQLGSPFIEAILPDSHQYFVSDAVFLEVETNAWAFRRQLGYLKMSVLQLGTSDAEGAKFPHKAITFSCQEKLSGKSVQLGA